MSIARTVSLINGTQGTIPSNTWAMLIIVSTFLIANSYLVEAAILKEVGDVKVVKNLVPKVHAMSDIYCQLIPNNDDNDQYYEVVPRIGAFEVSINGVVSSFISLCVF